MSKRTPKLPQMPSNLSNVPQPPPESKKFLAMLLLAQKGECTCLSCEYFKEFGNDLMDEYVKKS